MKSYGIMAAGLLAFAALPAFAAPVSFPECPAVGNDTTGCELLITVTTAKGIPGYGETATAFTVTTSSPDQGPFAYNGSDNTLIGVLNETDTTINDIYFTVAPGTGNFDFNQTGACEETGGVPIYSPAPAAAQCLQGQYQTIDLYDYASAGVTFLSLNGSFNLASAGIFVGELAPDASTWFDLPGAITTSEITEVTPTPEPASLALIGTGLSALYFMRRRKA